LNEEDDVDEEDEVAFTSAFLVSLYFFGVIAVMEV